MLVFDALLKHRPQRTAAALWLLSLVSMAMMEKLSAGQRMQPARYAFPRLTVISLTMILPSVNEIVSPTCICTSPAPVISGDDAAPLL